MSIRIIEEIINTKIIIINTKKTKNFMEELEKKWEEFLQENLPAVIESLHLEYEERVEHEIARAICLWKFSKDINSNEERREFLRPFVVDESISFNVVKTIAMIESLPDRVWRKLLWKENMDFMSRESFLRRLTNRQKIAIRSAYDSLFGKEPVIPVCLSEGFLYKITHLFKKESVESLLSEDYSDYNRMQSKGAWAFNLLELDFGFSLYPNGEDDDTMITNKKWTRFLSIKEHINDFIVNQEFGMYWKLYRSARSNYVISPNKKVQLSNHVCPGFWMTLFIHAMFWIISPGIAALCIFNIHIGFHLWEIPILLVGGITPLWLTIAFLKWGITALVDGIAKLFKIKLSDRAKKILKGIGIAGLVAIIIVLVGLCIWGIYYITTQLYIFGVLASPIIGSVLYVLSLLACIYWLIVICFLLNDGDYDDIPTWIRRIGVFIPAALVLRLFDVYAFADVISWISFAATWVWGLITYAPALTVALVVIIVILGVATKLLILSEKDERTFAKVEKTIIYVSFFGLFIPSICFIIYAGVSSLSDLFSLFGVIPVLIKILFGLTVGIVLVLLSRYMVINTYTIEIREKSRSFAERLSEKVLKQDQKVMRKALMQHQEDDLNTILDFACTWFDKYRRSFINMTITTVHDTKELLKLSVQLNKFDNEEDRFLFMRYILLSRYTVKQAKSAVEKEKKQQKITDENFERITSQFGSFFIALWELIIWIPVNLWKLIVWFFTKVWRLLCTLKDLWNLFNKFCPYISKSKYID